jgi:hypothetical protein
MSITQDRMIALITAATSLRAKLGTFLAALLADTSDTTLSSDDVLARAIARVSYSSVSPEEAELIAREAAHYRAHSARNRRNARRKRTARGETPTEARAEARAEPSARAPLTNDLEITYSSDADETEADLRL